MVFRRLKSWFMGISGMPTCEEIVLFAYAYLEDQLEPDWQRKFSEHLEGCSNCSRFVDGYRALARPERLERAAHLDADFEERIVEFLKSESSGEGGAQ